jgi:hypothetical protein
VTDIFFYIIQLASSSNVFSKYSQRIVYLDHDHGRSAVGFDYTISTADRL